MDFLFNTNVQFFIAAYLVGGIPFGLLLAKKFAGVDIKSSGSGSIGATNVLRVVKETNPALAKKLGIATLALDAFKGFVVLALAYFIALAVWGISAKIIKISSLSSLMGVAALMIASFYIHPEMAHAPALIIGFILFYKHIPNIIRIVKGEEKRVI